MILVTGGTGLVGSHLLLQLVENGEKVRAIYRTQDSRSKTKNLFELYQKSDLFEFIDWVQADILDVPSLEIAFQDIQYVYHCAAFISFDPKDEDALRKTNIEGTANIVNFCLDYAIKKLCFVSSIAALGDLAANETEITEATEWNPEKPHSDYAISKYGAEMEVWRGQQEGLEVVIVNPGVILGPGFPTQGSGKIFQSAKKGMSFYTNGSSAFIAVPDVINSMIHLMTHHFCNERYTLVAENITFKDLFFWLSDAFKVKRPSYCATAFQTSIASKIDGVLTFMRIKERTLSKATAIAAHTSTRYSNAKLVQQTQPDFTPIKEYIQQITPFF